MKNSLLFYAGCLVLLFSTHASAQLQPSVQEGETWIEQVENSLGKTFGDLTRRQIGPGAVTSTSGDGQDGKGGHSSNGIDLRPETGGSDSEDSNGGIRNPSRLDPNSLNIAALIREWLAKAEPPKNAEGANFRYTKWGSWEGQGIGGKTIRVDRPDAAQGMTSEAYVWSIRAQLDSIDHCLLEEYVLAKLAHTSIDHCLGRYQKSQGIAVANVVGLPGEKAKTILERLGLEVNFLMGPSANSEADVFTVIRQDYAPTKHVSPGTVVNLTIFDKFKSLIKVPSVAGLSNTAARNQLLAAGFTVKVKPVGKATEAKNAFTVKDTTPLANTEVKQGSLIVLNTYNAFDNGKIPVFEKRADCPIIARKSAKIGKTVSCHCSATATSKGSVFGTGFYTDDSNICRAALHAGEVTPEGGNVSFTMRKSQPHYDSTNRNGITSFKWGTYPGNSFTFRALSDLKERCPSNAVQYRGHDQVISCECTAEATGRGSIYGNGLYTDDSKICRAAVHAGEISLAGGHVALTMQEGQPTYEGITKNGVTSRSWGAFKGSFTFAAPLTPDTAEGTVKKEPESTHDTSTGKFACLCKGGDAYNSNEHTCDSPYSPASVLGGKSDTAYPSGSYLFTNECSYPIKSGERTEGLVPIGEGSNKLPSNAYIIDRIEIPKPSFQTTGSIICEIQISENNRVKHCKHHKDESLLKVQILHDFRLHGESGNVFVPGEKIYLEISGLISGHSTGYSIGDYVAADLEPRGGSFETESKSGDGDGWAMNNSDLPQLGRERKGSASMKVTRVATFPDTKGKPVKIVLTGSNGSSLVTYHLKPAPTPRLTQKLANPVPNRTPPPIVATPVPSGKSAYVFSHILKGLTRNNANTSITPNVFEANIKGGVFRIQMPDTAGQNNGVYEYRWEFLDDLSSLEKGKNYRYRMTGRRVAGTADKNTNIVYLQSSSSGSDLAKQSGIKEYGPAIDVVTKTRQVVAFPAGKKNISEGSIVWKSGSVRNQSFFTFTFSHSSYPYSSTSKLSDYQVVYVYKGVKP